MKTLLYCFSRISLVLLLSGGLLQTADAKSPITIGSTASISGRYKEPSDMIQKGFRLWAREINEKGGLLGRKIKLITYDDKSDADTARRLYEKLIIKDKVDLLLSPYSTPITYEISQISEKHKMVMLAVAAAAKSPWQRGFSYLFQLYAPADRQFIGLLDLMAQNNLKTACILYDKTSDFNIDMAKGVKKWAGTFKINLIYQKGYENGKTQLPGILKMVKGKNPSGLILSAYPPDSYEMLRLLQNMNYRPTMLAMPIVPAHPDFYKKVGEMADLVLGPSQWEPSERIPFPGTKQFIIKFKEFTGHQPSFHATSAYSSCQILEKAIIDTQSLNHLTLRNYIASLNTVTVLGRFKLDHTGKQVGHNSFIIQWQDGKKEIVWPDKMKTATAIIKTPEN